MNAYVKGLKYNRTFLDQGRSQKSFEKSGRRRQHFKDDSFCVDRSGNISPLLRPRASIGQENFILSTHKKTYNVHGVIGPLSIKWMASGLGRWRSGSRLFQVAPRSYLVFNKDQEYSVEIGADEPTESFCVFFRSGFVEDVHRASTTDDDTLLSNPYGAASSPLYFYENVEDNTGDVIPALLQLRAALIEDVPEGVWLETQFHLLAQRLVRSRHDCRQSVNAIPAARAATREELYRRLRYGRDYIHEHFTEDVSISNIASASCLSPHHFHRLFTGVFRATPHQYLIKLRIERAKELLARTERPVTDICLTVGYESLGSFSTCFTRIVGMSPTSYRGAHAF